jgi:hydrogenase maturation protease
MAGVLIVGYGNELRSDDAAGYHLALRLADDPRLAGADVLARRQLTPELALDASRAATLILLDATTELSAGAVAVRRLEPGVRGDATWSHHLTPAALLGLAGELYGATPETYLVSLGVASLEMEERLSAEVEAALPEAAEAVVALAGGTADA